MGKMVKLGAAALSMLWIFLMLVWVQAKNCDRKRQQNEKRMKKTEAKSEKER